MKVTIGRRLLNWHELVTLTTEVEAIVNTRPLTYLYEDIESGTALRPIDFLVDLPVGIPNMNQDTKLIGGDATRHLIRHYKYRSQRLDALWNFWRDEYLLSLRERGQTSHRKIKSEVHRSPKLNEIIILKDLDAPRGSWKLAKIIRITPSADGKIRSVDVKLPNQTVLRRAVNYLYPLELESESQDDDTNGHIDQNLMGAEHGFLTMVQQNLTSNTVRFNSC